MSEYVEKCPCCNNHSLEVTQHDWGEERRCVLFGFAVAPSLPTQAHVGNAIAFVSAACSWSDEKRLDVPLDEHLAEAVRSGAGTLVFAGERKVSREEAERLAEEFQAEVIDKFYVREKEKEDDSQESRVQVEEPGERVTIRLPQEAWNTLWESLEIDARSTAVAPELRRELREALDQVEHVTASPPLVQAAKDVLEWAAQMGGWEAPCWERLRQAVREAAAQGESPGSAEAVPGRSIVTATDTAPEPIRCPACGCREFVRIVGGIEIVTEFTFDEARRRICLRLDREEMREPDDGAHYYKRYYCGKCGAELPEETMDRINDEEFREEAVR
ncbi:MAG: hypothetical protein ACYTFI_12785 [Planctomycetota bacterium]|jgi:hypothetical protein